MSLPYIKIESEEGINSRRYILSGQMNLLNLINKMNEYKKLRKTELIRKARLRTLTRQNIARINALFNELPQVENIKTGKIKPLEKKKKDIDSELAEISNKLSKIS